MDFVEFADGNRTGKLQKALDLRDEGAAVEIIAERDSLGCDIRSGAEVLTIASVREPSSAALA